LALQLGSESHWTWVGIAIRIRSHWIWVGTAVRVLNGSLILGLGFAIAIRIEWIAHMALGWDCNLGFNGSLLLDNKFLCPFTTNVMTAACQEEIFWRSVHGRAVLFCFLEVAKAQIGG